MDPESDIDTARQLRWLRSWRGKSLRVVAGLAGITESHLARLERGERRLNNRRLIARLADALDVSPSELLGHPVRLKESIVVGAQATVPAVRLALVTHRLGTPLALNGSGRGVRELETEAQRAVALRTACDMPGLGLMLPELLVDLHAVVASSGGDDRVSALEGLMHGYASASAMLHMLGYAMDAWEAAARSVEVATELGAGWRAVAAFTLTHALLPMGTEAHEHAYQTASDSADQARGLTGHVQGDPALAAYGSLCLVSALAAAVTRRSAEAAERIAEAEELAVRVGECSPTVATFGPTNVAMYQMKSALEVGDCELAASWIAPWMRWWPRWVIGMCRYSGWTAPGFRNDSRWMPSFVMDAGRVLWPPRNGEWS